MYNIGDDVDVEFDTDAMDGMKDEGEPESSVEIPSMESSKCSDRFTYPAIETTLTTLSCTAYEYLSSMDRSMISCSIAFASSLELANHKHRGRRRD